MKVILLKTNKSVLLVEPNYRQAKRTKHEAKLCRRDSTNLFYHKSLGDQAELVRGCVLVDSKPDLVKVTSLFTYWSDDVFRAVKYYSALFPKATVMVGGILASLIPEAVEELFPGVVVHKGIDKEAEDSEIDWVSLGRSVQIVHASGNLRNISYCRDIYGIDPEVLAQAQKETLYGRTGYRARFSIRTNPMELCYMWR